MTLTECRCGVVTGGAVIHSKRCAFYVPPDERGLVDSRAPAMTPAAQSTREGAVRMSGPAYLGNPHDSPIWQELADALDAAIAKHPPMHSPHEGWGVIYEELVKELGEHVWDDTGRSAEARKEAIQVAAMGLRYALDLTMKEPSE